MRVAIILLLLMLAGCYSEPIERLEAGRVINDAILMDEGVVLICGDSIQFYDNSGKYIKSARNLGEFGGSWLRGVITEYICGSTRLSGERFATIDADNIKIWRFSSCIPEYTIPIKVNTEDRLEIAGISASSAAVVVGRELYIYDEQADGSWLKEYVGMHDGDVSSIAASTAAIFTGVGDMLHMWRKNGDGWERISVDTGQNVRRLAADHDRVAMSSFSNIILWEYSGKELEGTTIDTEWSYGMHFIDENTIVAGDLGGEHHILRFNGKKWIKQSKKAGTGYDSVDVISAYNGGFISVIGHETVYKWTEDNGQFVGSIFSSWYPRVTAFTMPDKRRVITGYSNGALVEWEYAAFKWRKKIIEDRYKYILSLDFTEDGELVSTSIFGRIKAWKKENGEWLSYVFDNTEDCADEASFFPDGRFVINSYDESGGLYIWEKRDESWVNSERLSNGSAYTQTSALDDDTFAAGTRDAKVYIYRKQADGWKEELVFERGEDKDDYWGIRSLALLEKNLIAFSDNRKFMVYEKNFSGNWESFYEYEHKYDAWPSMYVIGDELTVEAEGRTLIWKDRKLRRIADYSSGELGAYGAGIIGHDGMRFRVLR